MQRRDLLKAGAAAVVAAVAPLPVATEPLCWMRLARFPDDRTMLFHDVRVTQKVRAEMLANLDRQYMVLDEKTLDYTTGWRLACWAS